MSLIMATRRNISGNNFGSEPLLLLSCFASLWLGLSETTRTVLVCFEQHVGSPILL